MNNKIIYLATTYKCSACKCMEVILKELHKTEQFNLVVLDYKELPEEIKKIKLTDFPTTIFIKDNSVKHSIVGTASLSKLKSIINKIDF